MLRLPQRDTTNGLAGRVDEEGRASCDDEQRRARARTGGAVQSNPVSRLAPGRDRDADHNSRSCCAGVG